MWVKLGLGPQMAGGRGSVRGPGRERWGYPVRGWAQRQFVGTLGPRFRHPVYSSVPAPSASRELSLIPLLCPALLTLV